ncbi:hypothetical protein WOLCODRAFT_19928 [Wolfiporia cocos MD-104 SS10]|uniref:Uncharacterized protein n=1 Tax=Wolfiporia cocos (strain MD-104) TaxID=742152 RepID=A0A2H3J9D1_WOLCO|nr:hypothetical protein WOLCODRAFT_19928 [Wolfiporia cocos MD-104 SS10]
MANPGNEGGRVKGTSNGNKIVLKSHDYMTMTQIFLMSDAERGKMYNREITSFLRAAGFHDVPGHKHGGSSRSIGHPSIKKPICFHTNHGDEATAPFINRLRNQLSRYLGWHAGTFV